MNYGDFSSVVQLGVSLHLGTALLQFYGDIGVQPLVRIIERIKALVAEEYDPKPSAAVRSDLDKLESDFDIFKIRLFHEYRKYVVANSVVALMLLGILIGLAYAAQVEVKEPTVTIVIVMLSTVPAPATLFALCIDAHRQMKPMKSRAEELERRAQRGQ